MTLTNDERKQIQNLLADATKALNSANTALIENKKKLNAAQLQYASILDAAHLPGITLEEQIVLLGVVVHQILPAQFFPSAYSADLGDGTPIFSGTGPISEALWLTVMALIKSSSVVTATVFNQRRTIETTSSSGYLGPAAKSLKDIPPTVTAAEAVVQRAKVAVQTLTDALAAT